MCVYTYIYRWKTHTFLRSLLIFEPFRLQQVMPKHGTTPGAGVKSELEGTWDPSDPQGINISFLISSLNGPKFQIKEVHGFKMVTHVHRSLCHSWFQCVRPRFFHPTTSRQIMADGKPTIWQPPHHASTKTRAAWPHGLLLEGFWANLWVFVKFRPEAFTGKKEHYTDWYAVESARYPDRPNTGSSRFWHTYTYTFCLKTTRLHDRELHKLHLLPWNPSQSCSGTSVSAFFLATLQRRRLKDALLHGVLSQNGVGVCGVFVPWFVWHTVFSEGAVKQHANGIGVALCAKHRK